MSSKPICAAHVPESRPFEGRMDTLHFVHLPMNARPASTSWLQGETLCILAYECVPTPLLSGDPCVYPKEKLLEKGMATHSSILASRIPWTEEPGRLHTVHGVAKSKTQLSDFQMWKFYEFFQEPSYCFLQQLYHFTLPPGMYRGSNFSTSSSTLIISICFDNDHPNGYEMVSLCGIDLRFYDD